MKKKIISLAILCVLALSAGIYYYVHQPKNIFDEIYQETQKTYRSNNIFNQLSNVDVHKYQEYSSDSELYPNITYHNDVFSEDYSNVHLTFHFTQATKTIFISFEKELSTSTRLWIFGKYSLGEKLFQKDVQIILENGNHDNYIDNESEVKSYLKKYGITTKDLDGYYDKIVNQKVLKDWCSIYDSQFSPEDYGNVTVKTQWENW
ncbi:TipC family immunity protein [Streptococcus caballi]|uniref:TipC family immunity protein n=1 Tax=Streptococcus caballi TaxID=439220 RepID=UPI000370C12E|nr:TipC family immunity protein [Streptococcus caballi]